MAALPVPTAQGFALGLFHVNPSDGGAVGQRLVVMGNAGAGKSWLAHAVALHSGAPVIALDDIYWENAEALRKRGEAAARQLLRERTAARRWIVEGVFSWLIEAALAQTTQLIWLDLPAKACIAALAERGPLPGQSRAEYDDLVTWAALYDTRTTPTSRAGHGAIHAGFAGAKVILRSRDAMAAFICACHQRN